MATCIETGAKLMTIVLIDESKNLIKTKLSWVSLV